MPTLQVRDVSEEIYQRVSYLAEKDHRSIAQETLVLIEEGLRQRLSGQEKRKRLLREFRGLGVDARHLPDPATLIREDRDSR